MVIGLSASERLSGQAYQRTPGGFLRPQIEYSQHSTEKPVTQRGPIDWQVQLPPEQTQGRLQSFIGFLRSIGPRLAQLRERRRLASFEKNKTTKGFLSDRNQEEIDALLAQQTQEMPIAAKSQNEKPQVIHILPGGFADLWHKYPNIREKSQQHQQTLVSKQQEPIHTTHAYSESKKSQQSGSSDLHNMLATQPGLEAVRLGASQFYEKTNSSGWREWNRLKKIGKIPSDMTFEKWVDTWETFKSPAVSINQSGDNYATRQQEYNILDVPTIGSKYSLDDTTLPHIQKGETATMDVDRTRPGWRVRIKNPIQALRATARLIKKLPDRTQTLPQVA